MSAVVIPFPQTLKASARSHPRVYVQASSDDGGFDVVFQKLPNWRALVLASYDEWSDADAEARSIAAFCGATYLFWSPSDGDAA